MKELPKPANLRIVLLGDDTSTMGYYRHILHRILSEPTILEFTDIFEVLAEIRRQPPDLLILDWTRAFAGGVAVFPMFARFSKLCPVMITSGSTSQQEVERFIAPLENVHFLCKPFWKDIEETFISQVNGLLLQHQEIPVQEFQKVNDLLFGDICFSLKHKTDQRQKLQSLNDDLNDRLRTAEALRNRAEYEIDELWGAWFGMGILASFSAILGFIWHLRGLDEGIAEALLFKLPLVLVAITALSVFCNCYRASKRIQRVRREQKRISADSSGSRRN